MGYQDKHDEYDDTYISHKWEKEAEEQFDSFVQTLYDDVGHMIKYRSSLEENDEVPLFKEVSDQYKDLYNYTIPLMKSKLNRLNLQLI